MDDKNPKNKIGFLSQPKRMLSKTLPLHFDAGDIHLSVAWIKISEISWDTRPFHLAFKFGVQLRQSTQKNVVKNTPTSF